MLCNWKWFDFRLFFEQFWAVFCPISKLIFFIFFISISDPPLTSAAKMDSNVDGDIPLRLLVLRYFKLSLRRQLDSPAKYQLNPTSVRVEVYQEFNSRISNQLGDLSPTEDVLRLIDECNQLIGEIWKSTRHSNVSVTSTPPFVMLDKVPETKDTDDDFVLVNIV